MKRVEIFARLIVVFAGVCLALIFLLVALFPSNAAKTAKSPAVWIGTALFLIVFIELSWRGVQQALSIRNKQIQYDSKTVAAKLASAIRPITVAAGIAGAVTFLAMLGFFVSISARLFASGRLTMSAAFIVQVIVYVGYLLFRAPLMSRLQNVGSKIGEASRKSRPTYQIVPDGFILDLKFKDLSRPGGKTLVRIGFNEIEEMRTFSFAEAQTFSKYRVGPDIKLSMAQAKGLSDFLNGKIPRPTVLDLIASSGTTLFLRGPSLFYLLTVGKTDVTDLLNAYMSFKSTHQVSA